MNFKGALKVLTEKAVAVSYKASEITGYTIYGTAAVDWLKGRSGHYMNTGYAGNDTVYSVMRVLLDKITEAPLGLNKVIDEKSSKRLYHIKAVDDHKIIQHKLLSLKAFDEVTEDPILDILNNPNSYQSSIEFWEAFWGWYTSYGDTYIFALTAGDDSRNAGQPVSLHIIPASIVTKQYGGDVWSPEIRYQFTLRGVKFDLDQDQMFNMSKWNPLSLSPYGDGLSPMQPGSKIIVKNDLNQTAQASAFKNGGSVTLLSGDPNKGALSPQQMDAMKQHIQDQMVGAENNKNIVMTNGYMNVQKVGDTLSDMQLVLSDEKDRVKIATLFGVDPILVGDKSASSYNNAAEAYKGLVRNVVVSALNKRDLSVTNWLLPKYNKVNHVLRTDISYYSELQPDYAIVSSYVSNPKLILTSDEIRVLFGFDTKGGNFEKAIVPSGYMDYEQVFQSIDSIDQALKDYDGGY